MSVRAVGGPCERIMGAFGNGSLRRGIDTQIMSDGEIYSNVLGVTHRDSIALIYSIMPPDFGTDMLPGDSL